MGQLSSAEEYGQLHGGLDLAWASSTHVGIYKRLLVVPRGVSIHKRLVPWGWDLQEAGMGDRIYGEPAPWGIGSITR